MTLRRNFLAALTAPLLARGQSRGAGAGALPHPDDPAYWARVRDQFPLARDKVFFNNGTIGAMPAVQNAVIDAVRHLGVRHIDMPCTPERVWQAVRDAPSDPWREPPAFFADLPVRGSRPRPAAADVDI